VDDGVVVLVAGQVAVALLAQVAGRVAGQVVGVRRVEGVLGLVLAVVVGLDACEDIYFAKDWLGHKNIQNTIIYSKFGTGTRDRAYQEHLEWYRRIFPT